MINKRNSIGLAAMIGAAAVLLPNDVDSKLHSQIDEVAQQEVDDSAVRGILRIVHLKLQEELGQTHRELCGVPKSGVHQVDDVDTLVAIDGCLQKVERTMKAVPMQDSRLDKALRDRMATECHMESDSWQNAMREVLRRADVVPQNVGRIDAVAPQNAEWIDVDTPQDAIAKTRMDVAKRLGLLQISCAFDVTADLVKEGVEKRIQSLKKEIELER